MKHFILLFFFVQLFFNAFSQKSQLSIYPIIGFRITDDKEPLPGFSFEQGRRKMFPFLSIGLELSHKKYPLTLSFQRDFRAEINPFNIIDTSSTYISSLVYESRIINYVFLYYQFRPKFRFGVGHSWLLRESFADYLIPINVVSVFKGIDFSMALQHSRFSFELRRIIPYSPLFEPFGQSNTSLSVIYKIGKASESEIDATKKSKIRIDALVGGRFFHPEGIKTISGEQLSKIVLAPIVGIEILWKKQNLSFNADKDFWFGINSGSYVRNFKGFISNTSLGFKYHDSLSNGHRLRYGVSATWIDDFQNKRENEGPLGEPEKLRYDDFGIGANISYELIQNWDLEIKHTFTLVDDKSPFTLRRFSVGLIHRFNPYR